MRRRWNADSYKTIMGPSHIVLFRRSKHPRKARSNNELRFRIKGSCRTTLRTSRIVAFWYRTPTWQSPNLGWTSEDAISMRNALRQAGLFARPPIRRPSCPNTCTCSYKPPVPSGMGFPTNNRTGVHRASGRGPLKARKRRLILGTSHPKTRQLYPTTPIVTRLEVLPPRHARRFA